MYKGKGFKRIFFIFISYLGYKQKLVKGGAEVNGLNKDLMIIVDQQIPVYIVGQKTPLHYAAEGGHLECVKYVTTQPTAARQQPDHLLKVFSIKGC